MSHKLEAFLDWLDIIGDSWKDFHDCFSSDKANTKVAKFEWTDECEQAFQELKHRLTMAPVLTPMIRVNYTYILFSYTQCFYLVYHHFVRFYVCFYLVGDVRAKESKNE